MANFFTRPKFEDRQLVQYSGTSITLSGETNIYPTGLLRIQKNPVPGYVATAAGWDGEVVWGPVSGLTWNLSASCNNLSVNPNSPYFNKFKILLSSLGT